MSWAKDFGAAGDGVADDTDALQHAVDEGDGVLELARGTYRIAKPVVLDTTQRGCLGVRGAQGSARIVMAGPGPALRVVGGHQGTADPDSVQAHTWDNERMPMLSGFEVLGGHPEADGIELVRTMQTIIRGVLVRKCRHGIRLAERNRNFILADSHIYDCSDTGLFLDNVNLHQTNIFGNHISYCRRAGIYQLNGDVHNVQITGNDIEYNFGHEANSGEIVLEVPESGLISEFTIANNTLQAKPEAHGANLLMIGRVDDVSYNISEISITGNVIGSREKSIFISGTALCVAITGNTIYGGFASNVHLKHCGGTVIGSNSILPMGRTAYDSTPAGGVLLEDCKDCQVVGNILNDHSFGDESAGGSVTLRRCRDTSVLSCQIHRPKHRGVHLDQTHRCKVSDNTIVDGRGEATMLAAVDVTGGTANVIQNNTMSAGAQGAIRCSEEQGMVLNNTVLNA